MICKNCGNEIDINQKVCPKCGELLEKRVKKTKDKKPKEINGTIVYCIIGLIFPIIGIIVYIMSSKKDAIKSKSLLISSIIGLIFQILII